MTSFENNNNAYFASPFVRNWLLRAAGDEDGDQISCEIAHEFDDVSFRCELHSSTASKDEGRNTLALVSIAFPKSNEKSNERVTTKKTRALFSSAFERGRALGIIRKVRVLGESDDAEEEEEHRVGLWDACGDTAPAEDSRWPSMGGAAALSSVITDLRISGQGFTPVWSPGSRHRESLNSLNSLHRYGTAPFGSGSGRVST